MAGSWLIASVWSDFTTAISSAMVATFGSNSLTQVPALPCWANLNREGATGRVFWPEVIAEQRGQGDGPDPGGRAAEELAAGLEQVEGRHHLDRINRINRINGI